MSDLLVRILRSISPFQSPNSKVKQPILYFFKYFKMASEKVKLPLINLDRYVNPVSAEDQEAVVQEVLEACKRFGFFQVKGHGIPMSVQAGLIAALKEFFTLPKEDKLALSFLKNRVRRGYETSGDTLREGDKMPDSKEVIYSDIHSIGEIFISC